MSVNIIPELDPDMTPNELKLLCQKHGLTQAEMGQFLGHAPRSMRRYVCGEAVIPRSSVLLLRMIERHNCDIVV